MTDTSVRHGDPQSLLDDLFRLHRIYSAIQPRQILGEPTVRGALHLLEEIALAAQDPDLNRALRQFIENWAGGIGYQSRAQVLADHHPKDSLWTTERDLLAKYGISADHLSKLRRRAQHYFGRRLKMTHHASQRFDSHAFSGPMPLVELVNALRTRQFLEVGLKNTPSPKRKANNAPLLSLAQKQARRRLGQHDASYLVAGIMLLANYLSENGSVFKLSYTLAVGEAHLR
jgi:hypothetical protein